MIGEQFLKLKNKNRINGFEDVAVDTEKELILISITSSAAIDG